MRLHLGLLFVIVNFVLLLIIGSVLLLWNYQSSLQFSKQEAGRFFEQSRILAESILDAEAAQIPKALDRLEFDPDNLLLWDEQQSPHAKKELKRSLERQLDGGLDLAFLAIGEREPIMSGFVFFDTDEIFKQLNKQKEELQFGRRVVELELDGKKVVFLVATKKVVDDFTGRVLGYVVGLTELGSHFGILQEIKERSRLDGVGILYHSRLLASDFPSGVFDQKQPSQWNLSEDITESANHLSVARAINIHGAHSEMGIVMVSKNFMPEILQKRLQKQAVVLLAILFSFGVSIWLLFRFLAERPIDRLTAYTSKLVDPEKETPPLATGIYEYDLIANHFKGLIDSLKESEQLHKTLFENTGASTFVFNQERMIERINSKGAEMVGLSQSDLLGKTWDTFVHPDDLSRMLELNKKRFKLHENLPSEYEFRLKPFTGEVVVCKMVVALFPGGKRGIATFFSIDAEKKLQRQLEEINEKLELKVHQRTRELSHSNARLDEAQKIAHIGSFEWHLDDDRGEWSSEMYRLLGYGTNEVAASLDNFLTHVQDKEKKSLLDEIKRCRQGRVLGQDIHIKVAGGGEKTLHMIASCSDDHVGHDRIVGTMQDVTEIRIMENEKRNNEQLLIQQSRLAAMGEMIGAIAHQWRQPLAAVGGILINIQDGIEYGDVDKEEFAKFISNAEELLKYMSGTIDDFRGFFKPSHQKEHFDVVVAVCKAAHMVTGLLKNHQVSMRVTKHPGTDRAVTIQDYIHPPKEPGMESEGYPNELQQVFINLFTNSKDAILEHEQTDGRIDVGIYTEKDHVIVEVKDNGGGADDDVLQKAFDPYFTTKEEGKGTGIGLYMAKMIVEKNMDGWIDAVNENGGLKVTVKLPLRGEGDGEGICG